MAGRVVRSDKRCQPLERASFHRLGAATVDSLDYSAYEGAALIHDMNLPWPSGSPPRQYDLVHDGGTLEHVFHLPQALSNAMSLVKPGGLFAGVSPCDAPASAMDSISRSQSCSSGSSPANAASSCTASGLASSGPMPPKHAFSACMIQPPLGCAISCPAKGHWPSWSARRRVRGPAGAASMARPEQLHRHVATDHGWRGWPEKARVRTERRRAAPAGAPALQRPQALATLADRPQAPASRPPDLGPRCRTSDWYDRPCTFPELQHLIQADLCRLRRRTRGIAGLLRTLRRQRAGFRSASPCCCAPRAGCALTPSPAGELSIFASSGWAGSSGRLGVFIDFTTRHRPWPLPAPSCGRCHQPPLPHGRELQHRTARHAGAEEPRAAGKAGPTSRDSRLMSVLERSSSEPSPRAAHAAVGANAVITKDVPDKAVAAGVPGPGQSPCAAPPVTCNTLSA